ncbi:MAG: sigma factor [Qipengyuania sp.]
MAGLASELETVALRCIDARSTGDCIRADRTFARLLRLLAPRIARLTRRYGLIDMEDDAAQACAIGIHRALESYAPARARFTTHVTWQMRGELQSLRHRVRLDQRQGARVAGVRTESLEGSRSAAYRTFVDADALDRTEQGASDAMALSLLRRNFLRAAQPAGEWPLLVAHIFDAPIPAEFTGLHAEQRRQIVRRHLRNCAKIAA